MFHGKQRKKEQKKEERKKEKRKEKGLSKEACSYAIQNSSKC